VNVTSPITLREAGSDDAHVLLRLMRAAFEEYEGVLDPPSGAHQETIDTVRRRLARGAAVVRLQLPHLVARYERRGYRTTKQMTHRGYAQPTFIYMEKRF
jgi:hypothetical protein